VNARLVFEEALVYRFQGSTTLDITQYPEPSVGDRSGPPLTQGFLLTLIATVMPDYCSPETLAVLNQIDPQAWYHGELLETVLDEFERKDPALPAEIGKNIYYTLRSQFVAMGLQTPSDVINSLPSSWLYATRGDSGEWRSTMLGPQHARIELEQPYNCQFEQGAMVGALESFDAADVTIDHTQCMRHGAPYCVFDVRWQE
jgi:hypothetical protein